MQPKKFTRRPRLDRPDGHEGFSLDGAPREGARPRTVRLVRPVLLSGIATVLLFAAVDRSQPWSLISAVMGIALLGVVLVRQLGEILALEQQLENRERKLHVVSEVVSALNSSPSVGSTLSEALDRLLAAMDATVGAIWLPATEGGARCVLVEQRGMPDPERAGELLERMRQLPADAERTRRSEEMLPGQAEGAHPVQVLSYSMGREGEEFGYLLLGKETGHFANADAGILAAVGSDVAGALRSVRMLSEARRLADRDPVTGLHNHRSVYQRMHAEVERHKTTSKSMAVLMMDLDNFKLFNDTYGHPSGDEVLKRVSGILRRSCRDADVVARYGGDEFLVVLPETNLRQAVKCAERIQTALARERFRCQDSASLPIGLSYGISVFPDDAADVQEMVAMADAHLYESKSHGGNQITSRSASRTDSTLVYVKGFDLFRAMVSAIDNKDGYTRKHSEEVTEYSVAIAKAMNLSEETVHTIQISGILHDVGKIGVPDAILRKPGKLTDEEFGVMRQHPLFGALIVGAMPGMEQVVLGVRNHHERYDGRGYPDGLAGEEIPLIGRIMAVADAYSAMTTSRPYRKGMTERQALQEIRNGLGTQFDPEIGLMFVHLREGKPAASAPRTRRARTVAVPSALPEPAAAAMAV